MLWVPMGRTHQKSQAGDRASLTCWCVRNALAYNIAYRCWATTTLLDATQTAFVAPTGHRLFRRDATFSTWLYRIVTNACPTACASREGLPELSLVSEDTGGLIRDTGRDQ